MIIMYYKKNSYTSELSYKVVPISSSLTYVKHFAHSGLVYLFTLGRSLP